MNLSQTLEQISPTLKTRSEIIQKTTVVEPFSTFNSQAGSTGRENTISDEEGEGKHGSESTANEFDIDSEPLKQDRAEIFKLVTPPDYTGLLDLTKIKWQDTLAIIVRKVREDRGAMILNSFWAPGRDHPTGNYESLTYSSASIFFDNEPGSNFLGRI